MSKKIIVGAVSELAAGVAAYFYNKNKSKIDEAAADAYDTMNEALNNTEKEVKNILS